MASSVSLRPSIFVIPSGLHEGLSSSRTEDVSASVEPPDFATDCSSSNACCTTAMLKRQTKLTTDNVYDNHSKIRATAIDLYVQSFCISSSSALRCLSSSTSLTSP